MRLGIFAAVALFAAGCGGSGPRARLHGSVKLAGVPVTNGVVVFVAGDNMTYLADIHQDGTYAVDGVPYGPVTVSVQQSPPRPPPRPTTPGKKSFGEAKDAQVAEESPDAKIDGPVVPKRYSDPGQSGLAFEVKQPDQEWSADLTP